MSTPSKVVPSGAYSSKGAKPIELATVIVLVAVTDAGSSARAAASTFVAGALAPLVAAVLVAELLLLEQALSVPVRSVAAASAPTIGAFIRREKIIWCS
jgi:hypothetical protein